MNLDDINAFIPLDPQDMYAHIDGLPQQLADAWELGMSQPVPRWRGLDPEAPIHQVLVAGMGGSAIGADLLSAYLEPVVHVPVFVHRDYGLPAWAKDSGTLVIASSHSGNTEETLDSFATAKERGCRILAITTGGKLAKAATEIGAPVWVFNHTGQPRAAVGYSFGLLLALFKKLALLPSSFDVERDLDQAVEAMRAQQLHLRREVPAVNNPAKRIAGQLVGRMPAVIASGLLSPVARRWKGQVSEIGKAWAQFEFIPEADHNTLAGTLYPEELLGNLVVIFLQADADHPRNSLRIQYTKEVLMLEGIGTDFIRAEGKGRLAQQWTALHYGDYVSYYLAMAYQVDPTPVSALLALKARLDKAG